MEKSIRAVKHSKTRPVGKEPNLTNFGTRAVSNQNFSKIVALPKQALTNCGKDVKRVNVTLVQDGIEKFLKLTPVGEDE